MMSSTDSPNGQSPINNTHEGPVLVSRRFHDTPAVGWAIDDTARSAASGELHLGKLIDRALRATGHLCLGDLDFVVTGGAVVLRGKLSRYYLKQVTYAIVRAI